MRVARGGKSDSGRRFLWQHSIKSDLSAVDSAVAIEPVEVQKGVFQVEGAKEDQRGGLEALLALGDMPEWVIVASTGLYCWATPRAAGACGICIH